jgi:hypothetical protein
MKHPLFPFPYRYLYCYISEYVWNVVVFGMEPLVVGSKDIGPDGCVATNNTGSDSKNKVKM